MKIAIYIPQPGSTLATSIEPGSVVVPIGSPRPDGVHAVCWESRVFAERLPSTFADRAEKAHERSRDTRNDKRKLVYGTDILSVGHLETATGTVELACGAGAAAIAEWIGTVTLDPAELTTTRGLIVKMMSDSVREHGDRLTPAAELTTAYGDGRSAGFYSKR